MGLKIGIGGSNPRNTLDQWYGIEWDVTVASTTCTRIGRIDLHQNLPIQSRMKGCLLSDTGVVNKYLTPANWSTETREGSLGQVMVEIPEHYERFEAIGNKRRACISDFALPGYHFIPKMYISAYEASLQRSNLKLSSVINLSTDFRGGSNTAAWDAASNTLLGRPVTSISRTQFRTYARNRGLANWNLYTYNAHKNLFWLYYIEYANLNCQLAFNAAPDANGFKQGGLGSGVTTWDANWNTFNAYNPFVPCGFTDSLGNFSGEVQITVPYTTPKLMMVNRYRGIEMPFGHIWKNADGVNVNIKTDAAGGTSEVFVCSDPSLFSDTLYTGYQSRGLIARTNNYVKEIIHGEYGDILPTLVGGGSTTYWSDYFYTDITSSSLRTVLFGGNATYGVTAGLACADSHNAPASAFANVGSRLAFFPSGA